MQHMDRYPADLAVGEWRIRSELQRALDYYRRYPRIPGAVRGLVAALDDYRVAGGALPLTMEARS